MKAVRANNKHLTDSQTEAAETLQQIFLLQIYQISRPEKKKLSQKFLIKSCNQTIFFSSSFFRFLSFFPFLPFLLYFILTY